MDQGTPRRNSRPRCRPPGVPGAGADGDIRDRAVAVIPRMKYAKAMEVAERGPKTEAQRVQAIAALRRLRREIVPIAKSTVTAYIARLEAKE